MLWHLINYGLTFNLSREKIKRYPNRNKYFNFFVSGLYFFVPGLYYERLQNAFFLGTQASRLH